MELFYMNGYYSKENYNSIDEPFFSRFVKGQNKPPQKLKETENLLNKILLPKELVNLYRQIGNPNVEYYLEKWTIMSLTNVIKRYDIMRRYDQTRVIDFAFSYTGMGHIIVVAIDPYDGKIFYRHDGGGNGYERKLYFDFISNYIPDEKNKFIFTDFLKIIKKKDIPEGLKIINN